MPGARATPRFTVAGPTPGFTIGAVALAWALCQVAAAAVSGTLAGVGHVSDPAEGPTWFTVSSAVSLWVPLVVATVVLSRREGSGRYRDDFRLRTRAIDMAGLPIGVLSQLVLVPLIYLPLRAGWPDTFTDDKLQERARGLWERADGFWVVALVVVVALGAPLVEELVYRGLILQTLQSRIADPLALVVSAAFFAVIHLQATELPGLFAVGLVFGACFQRTGRLTCPILAHAAFNVTGLALAAAS